MEIFHSVFRVTSEEKNKNNIILGDRDLAVFISRTGSYIFSTYKYLTTRDEGESNLIKEIHHDNSHEVWHFIYFAYSHIE
jgi:hypothetical protein